MPGPLFRIPIPIRKPTLRRPQSFKAAVLSPRKDDVMSGKPKATTIAVACVVATFILIVAAVIITRTLRSRHPNPKYIPTPFLKRLWSDWKVPSPNTRHTYEPTRVAEERSRDSAEDGLTSTTQTRQRGFGMAATSAAGGVDRNTSVRSVMTLPVYRPRATETEQVLGREGERDGIDTVVEMPTGEDEEALREEEMNALYQIRLTRRQQIAEREERRRLRREARQTNNVVALQELRQQTRNSTGRNTETIEELRAEHERIRETRQRAVSSVSYADLGVARADGTRIRANSTESERIGLLSDAASIGQHTTSSTIADSGLLHRRDRSSGSIVSIDTARTNDLTPDSPSILTGGSSFSLASMGRVRSNSGVNIPRAGSSPEMIDVEDGDLGDTSMPPPGYDDVSLDEANTPRLSRDISGRNSPYDEPPPNYPGGPAQIRNNRLSAHVEDLVASTSGQRSRANSSTGYNTPRLPSLQQLPQIVIDPASAR